MVHLLVVASKVMGITLPVKSGVGGQVPHNKHQYMSQGRQEGFFENTKSTHLNSGTLIVPYSEH